MNVDVFGITFNLKLVILPLIYIVIGIVIFEIIKKLDDNEDIDLQE